MQLFGCWCMNIGVISTLLLCLNVALCRSSQKGIFFDIDGTLYDRSANIESQLGDRIRSFMQSRAAVDHKTSEKWWKEYGSTIEGFLEENASDKATDIARDYYSEIFDDSIDMSGLLKIHLPSAPGDTTGYQHDSKVASLRQTHQAIKELTNRGLITTYLASNSPSSHVKRILNFLGLGDLKYKSLLAPDTVPKRCLRNSMVTVPASKTRIEYWSDISKLVDLQSCYLVDNSVNNLDFASVNLGMKVIKVDPDYGAPLPFALARIFNTVPDQKSWKFRDADYLYDKNKVDNKSMNQQVWKLVKEAVLEKTVRSDNECIAVADIGSGSLGMLEKIIELAQTVNDQTASKKLVYLAFESNRDLTVSSRSKLVGNGFTQSKQQCVSDSESNLSKELSLNHFVKRVENVEIHAFLASMDFQTTASSSVLKLANQLSDITEKSQGESFDLIIGACFADLFQPESLVAMLTAFAGQKGSLLYFPITFDGHTCFDPPVSLDNNVDGKWTMPTDQDVMDAYHSSLTNVHKHNLDSGRLLDSIKKFGGKVIATGRSDWHVKRSVNPYFWDCLAYFMGLGTTSILAPQAYDVESFFEKLRSQSPDIHVRNYDIFASLPNLENCETMTSGINLRGGKIYGGSQTRFVEFVAPRKAVSRKTEAEVSTPLSDSQIEIESDYSMISSGTELKFFKGEFDKSSLMDVNIESLKSSSSLDYPFRYGYSLSGRVTKVGPALKERDWLGKRLFVFHNHASKAIINASDAFVVPDFVSDMDAVFLPAVETALSLIHDANPRIGDSVAVVGQGLIGLMVSAILDRFHKTDTEGVRSKIGELAAVDINQQRLEYAKKIAPSCKTINPSHFKSMKGDKHPAGKGFDIVIEASGSPKGLQFALDNAGYGAKVVLGSWYGSDLVPLSLDLPFHRNRLNIITSQVSRIAGDLSDRWSKSRRFDLAWEILSLLRPSEHLRPKLLPIEECQTAYESLDRGEESIVLFDYHN